MIKMVATDVDDTLLTTQIEDETIDAIKYANNKGVEVVLCSGRPTNNLVSLAQALNDSGCTINYVSGFNGSEIYDLKQMKLLFTKGFDCDEITQITNILTTAGIDYGLYNENELIVNNLENEYAKLEAQLVKFTIKQASAAIASTKVLGFCDPNLTNQKVELLKTKLPNLQINKSKPFFIEITKEGVNKSLPIKVLSDILSIDLQNVAVFGDGDNDIAMYELNVGYKFVVANGSEKLKRMADKIIPAACENGVAKTLKEMI